MIGRNKYIIRTRWILESAEGAAVAGRLLETLAEGAAPEMGTAIETGAGFGGSAPAPGT